MKVQVALDRQTGFPCVRPEGAQDFVSLFPVTKLQAEEWIWKKGAASANLTELINRLEVRENWEQFPKAVRQLTRAPISRQQSENLLSIIATNLSLWVSDEETHNTAVEFPTPSSEWGRLIAWLRGRVPTYDDWVLTLDELSGVSTRAIIEGVLSTKYKWDPVVERLLWKVRDTLQRGSYSLPFMKKGLYELIANPEPIHREALIQRNERRPRVAGDSPIWPALSSEETSRWRPLRQSKLPVVTVRLWFSEHDVSSQIPNSNFRSFEAEEENEEDLQGTSLPVRGCTQADSRQQSRLSLRWLTGSRSNSDPRQKREVRKYVLSPEKMVLRCPSCYEQVERTIFMTGAHFCCYEEKVAIQKPDGSPGIRNEVKHSVQIPDTRVYEISRRYLDVAQQNPAAIHTVGLAGRSQTGKTAWLMSLGGLLDYPDAISKFYDAFPRDWRFSKKPCSLFNSANQEDPRDILLAQEKMWLDGIVPDRNRSESKAARLVIQFICTPNGKRQEILPVIGDMAGEAIDSSMFTSRNFSHLSWTSDIIFFLPADDLRFRQFDQFMEKLRIARANDKAIDLKKINLIFTISKIDILKHGPKQQQELLERILPRPYTFPRNHNITDLKRYIEEMHEVHYGIERWIRKHKPETEASFEEFGSVRYTGLSAFGFQPKREPQTKMEAEYTLPFGPDPVRAADPILWLMKENRLIEFNERN